MIDKLNCMNCCIGDFKQELCDCDGEFCAKYKAIGTQEDFIKRILKSGWISVSEKLPKTHKKQIKIVEEEDFIQVSNAVLAWGKRIPYIKEDPMMAVAWYATDDVGRESWMTAPNCECLEVVAWMPLPEPYEDKK